MGSGTETIIVVLCLLTDTSAVQAVEVVEGEECMFVTCYFAPGSTAQGCQVQLKIVATHSSQHLHSWQFNISQDPGLLMGTLHLPMEPRTTALDVAVYDLSASGRVGDLSIPPHVTHSTGLNCECGSHVCSTSLVTHSVEKANTAISDMVLCFV